jgi:hypothetical protein
MSHDFGDLYPCAHCNTEGTCRAGPDGSSCAVCVKKQELKRGQYIGIACGSCGGLGQTDTLTYRLAHRTQPLLSFVLVFGAFFLILLFGLLRSEYFNEVLAFCSTLIGGVTGYYFCSRSTQNRRGDVE